MTKKVLAVLIMATTSSLATDGSFSNHALTTKAGTLGVGIGYSTNITKNFDLRIGANSFSYAMDSTMQDIDYSLDTRLSTVSAILDYHLFSSAFTLSGGFVYNNNGADFTGEAKGGKFIIDGNEYEIGDIGSLNGKIGFDPISPYIGIGYSTVTKFKGLHFTAEMGVLYQNTAITSLDVQCEDGLPPAECAKLKNDVLSEKESLDEDIEDYKWYPVVSLGLAYTF
ncbi:MAG: hypothetical protein JJV95_01765 [Sulfurospirillum sp.]|nr:hypothetical protein [Sulfurospirillum sp.]